MTASRARVFAARSVRESPTRAGIGLGLAAGALSAVMLLLGTVTTILWVVVVGLGLPGACALIAASANPGWRGWRGFIGGLILVSVVWAVVNSMLQPDNRYVQGQFLIVGIVLIAGIWTAVASLGFALVALVRLLRKPPDNSALGTPE